MTRYAYNPQTFRMERQCSQRFVRTEQSGTVTFTPQSGTKRQDDRYLYDLEAYKLKNHFNKVQSLNLCPQ